MPFYYYKAKTGLHEIKTGTIEAESVQAVALRLKQMNYFPLMVIPATSKKAAILKWQFGLYATQTDIALVTRQLANLIEAGLPIIRAIQTLATQLDNPQLRSMFEEVKNEIQKGTTLSQSLSRYPKYFSAVDVNMIKSGEAAGNLDDVLTELADLKEEQMSLRSKVITAMAYPLLLLAVGALTIFILFSFVIPRFMGIFADLGQMLPLPTQILLNASKIFARFWYLIIIFAAGIVIILRQYAQSIKGKNQIDNFLLKVPLFGAFIREVETARFAKILAVLLKNGIPIIQAIRIVSTTINNSVIAKQISGFEEFLAKGEKLSTAIRNSPYFSTMVKNMVAVGEESGRLEVLLLKVSQHLNYETDRKLSVAIRLIEPAMILSLGVIIGFIVFAMLLPIFQLNILIK